MNMIFLSLPYFLLAGNAAASLFLKNKPVLWILLLFPLFPAYREGILTPLGLSALLLFSLVSYASFNIPKMPLALKRIGWLLLLGLITGFVFHKIPGFSNILAVPAIQITVSSCPFSMYLNFDKVMAALILYATSDLPQAKKTIKIRALKKTVVFLICSILLLLFPAWFAGYIAWEPKIPTITGIWMLNNFLFVCFSDEIIFRGIIQRKLTTLFPKHIFLSIMTASVLFGLMHFKAGVHYILFATLTGLLYGYTYHKTKRILCAILVHFGLNVTHFFFFTYPASLVLCR